MLLFLLVFNLIEINAIDTKCKRYYTRPESSFYTPLFYTFNPLLRLLPDFSKLEDQDHVGNFTCGNFCVDVSLARKNHNEVIFVHSVHKMYSRSKTEILAIVVEK